MKKKDVLDLIRYHTEHNDAAFRTQAYNIAKEFAESGDTQLSEYILALISNANTLVPQSASIELDSTFLTKRTVVRTSLPLPEPIANDIQGVLNAIGRNIGIHRFLFHGPRAQEKPNP